jgi:hypothetical protein
MDAPSSNLISFVPMTDSERTALRVLIDLEWAETRREYQDAGQPFGQGRGLEIWIEFDQQTTAY